MEKYGTIYMRQYRANKTKAQKEDERRRDREYKKMKRRTDVDWLARERARRREYGKIRVSRGDCKKQVQKYRSKVDSKLKMQARLFVMGSVIKGETIRPDVCEKCGRKPKPLVDKRSKSGFRHPLRADHYKGYDRKNWLVVQWICKDCDGKQLRSKKLLVED